MTAGRLLGLPNPALNIDGEPVAGAQLFFYQAGTAVLQNVYDGQNLITPLPNPLSANSGGQFEIAWGDTSLLYDVGWTDSGGANLGFFSNVSPTPPAGADILLSNLANNAQAQANLGLGTAAVENTGTSGHTIPFEDGAAAVTGAWSFNPIPTDATTGSSLGYLGAPINEQDGTYALVLADRGKCVQHNSGAAHNYTITKQATVAWTIGDMVAISNIGAGLLTLVRDTGVTLYLHGTTTNGPLNIPQNGLATILNVAANIWIASGDVS